MIRRPYDARVPGCLGRVLDSGSAPVATCFQFAPGFIATCWHVLHVMRADREGARFSIEALNGLTGPLDAIVARYDAGSDVAVARLVKPLPDVDPLFAPAAVS